MKLRVSKFKKPIKKITYKDSIELVMHGADMIARSYIYEHIELSKKFEKDDPMQKILGEQVVYRVIRTCLKEVNNLEVEDKETGEVKDFVLVFDDNDMIEEKCFDDLMDTLYNIPELITVLMRAYEEVMAVDVNVVEDKKKI